MNLPRLPSLYVGSTISIKLNSIFLSLPARLHGFLIIFFGLPTLRFSFDIVLCDLVDSTLSFAYSSYV